MTAASGSSRLDMINLRLLMVAFLSNPKGKRCDLFLLSETPRGASKLARGRCLIQSFEFRNRPILSSRLQRTQQLTVTTHIGHAVDRRQSLF